MNMNVYSKRDLGEIMPGWYAVPQNPIVRGIAGLGQANCPSMEQLQGIVDPTDPCQASQVSGSCPSGTTANFTQGGAGGTWVCTANSTPATSVAINSAAVPVSTIAGIPSNYLIIGALAIGVLAMMKGGR